MRFDHARGPALCLGAALAALAAGGCATTQTRLEPVPRAVIEAEEAEQRQLALETLHRQQTRLDDVAYPLLVRALPLCPDTSRRAGIRYANVYTLEEEWRAAAAAIGLGDTLEITGVARGSAAARAGLRPGDLVLSVAGRSIPPGSEASKTMETAWGDESRGDAATLHMAYLREGTAHDAVIRLDAACPYNTIVVVDGALNAMADGETVYVTSTMMRFAEDDELAVIVSHELAHNAMGHIRAKRQNALLGAILGAIGDVAMAYSGYNTGGYYTSQGAQLGAMVFSQDFEREADYVGLYALALADLPLDAALRLWRHMAQANPSSIGLAHSHPTTAERFVRMKRAIAEIEAKRAAGGALRPEREGEDVRKR